MKNIDIAKLLGISTTSVSLALNNRPGVSEITKKKILDLKQTTSSIPGQNNKTPSTQPNIIFVVHKKHGEIINDKPFFSDLISSIQQEAMSHSFGLNILHYNHSQNIEDFINVLSSANTSGIILLATEMEREDLQYYKIIDKPIVLLDSYFDLEHFDSVIINNQSSIFKAIEYAYNLGHRNIGYLKSSVNINNFAYRFDGYKNALRFFNLEDNNNPVFNLNCSIDLAYHGMKRILVNKPKDLKMPTIFISDLDYMALGAMRALKEEGYSIPGDISIIGFDNIAACEVFDPPLSTIRVNTTDIGRLAVIRLIKKINTLENIYITTQICTELVIRGSTASVTT